MSLKQFFSAPKKMLTCLLVLTFLVYALAIFNGFVWDDEEQVVSNVAVHALRNIPQHFMGSTFSTGGAGGSSGIYYKPLMSSSFTFLYVLGAGQAWVFHFFQILMHCANVGLVFFLLSKIFKKPSLSFFLTLVFALHPINVESVVYISALQDTQFLFFGLLALLSFIERKRLNFTGAKILPLVLLLASLLSKETGVIFLAIYPLYILMFTPKHFKKNWSDITLSLVGVFAVYLFMRLLLAGVTVGTQGLSPITTASPKELLLNTPKVIYFYLETFFWPKDLAIAQHWLVKTATWSDFYWPLIVVSLSLIFVAAQTLALWQRPDKTLLKQWLFFTLAFMIGLGLHLHLIPLDMTVADRWFYFPSIALLGMIGVLISQFKLARCSEFAKKLLVILALLLFLLLAGRSIMRISNWRDGLTLFSHDIKISTGAFDLENNLGTELARVGETEAAIPYFERSIELLPNWWTNWNNLGVMYQRQGDLLKAKQCYERAIDNGQYYLAYVNLAQLYLLEEDWSGAQEFLKGAVKILPYNADLRYALLLAEYYLGNETEALRQAKALYQLQPSRDTEQLYQMLLAGEKIFDLQ